MQGKIKRLLSAALAALALSACGYQPMMGPYAQGPYLQQPYNQNPYGQQAYDQYGQQGYVDQGYGFQNQDPTQYQDPGYGSEGYLPPDTNAYPESGWMSSPDPTASGYPAPQPTATPKPKPSPVDKAPDPIAPSVFNQVSENLSILSFDVWGLPGLLGTQRKQRFERLGDSLNAYDVVTLQAAYADDIEILKQTTGFQYHYRQDNDTLLKTGSGLYVLSKYPITTTDYVEFNQCALPDCFARKGVLFTRIEHPKLGPIDVYTAHYQGGDSAKAKQIRSENNNRLLQEFIIRHPSDNPVLITGDFNFQPEQGEYQDLNRRLPLVDVFKAKNPQDPGYTYDPNNPYLEGEGSPARLDYIFSLKKPGMEIQTLESAVVYREPVDGMVLSDRYGVSAKLKIRK